MKLSIFKFKTGKELREEHEKFNARRGRIFKKNEALIKKWRATPWWKSKPSFEEQRSIILSNWGMLHESNDVI